LASEFIPPEIVPIVWFACISVTVYVFFRVFSSTLREKFKQTNLSRRQAEKGGNTDDERTLPKKAIIIFGCRQSRSY